MGGVNPMWVGPPQAGGPGVFIKGGWASHWDRASQQCSSMTSASVSASRFRLWVPALTSFVHGLWCESKSFPLQVAFSHGVLSQQKKPKTDSTLNSGWYVLEMFNLITSWRFCSQRRPQSWILRVQSWAYLLEGTQLYPLASINPGQMAEPIIEGAVHIS